MFEDDYEFNKILECISDDGGHNTEVYKKLFAHINSLEIKELIERAFQAGYDSRSHSDY